MDGGHTVTVRDKYYTAESRRLEPKPLTIPHPPIWTGGWGRLTLRRAATLADNWLPGPTADLARLLEGKQQCMANRAAAGRATPMTEWPLWRAVIIADSNATARELAECHITRELELLAREVMPACR